jgi:hypothetical protein
MPSGRKDRRPIPAFHHPRASPWQRPSRDAPRDPAGDRERRRSGRRERDFPINSSGRVVAQRRGFSRQNPIDPLARHIRQNRFRSKGGKFSKGGSPPFAGKTSLRRRARSLSSPEGRLRVRREACLPSRQTASLRRPDGSRPRREASHSKGGLPPFATVGLPSSGGQIVSTRAWRPDLLEAPRC